MSNVFDIASKWDKCLDKTLLRDRKHARGLVTDVDEDISILMAEIFQGALHNGLA